VVEKVVEKVVFVHPSISESLTPVVKEDNRQEDACSKNYEVKHVNTKHKIQSCAKIN